METIKVHSAKREEMVEITREVQNLLPETGDGICVLFTQHTTCGLTINENADPDVPFAGDGEPISRAPLPGQTPVVVEVMPASLKVLAPIFST